MKKIPISNKEYKFLLDKYVLTILYAIDNPVLTHAVLCGDPYNYDDIKYRKEQLLGVYVDLCGKFPPSV